jgi:hypothetical protein
MAHATRRPSLPGDVGAPSHSTTPPASQFVPSGSLVTHSPPITPFVISLFCVFTSASPDQMIMTYGRQRCVLYRRLKLW